MQHTIIMMQLTPGVFMHGYLMCQDDDTRSLNGVIDKMVTAIEERGGSVWAPIILSTKLNEKKDIAEVHRIMDRFPDIAKMRKKAKTLHYAAWLMTGNDPDHHFLYALH